MYQNIPKPDFSVQLISWTLREQFAKKMSHLMPFRFLVGWTRESCLVSTMTYHDLSDGL